MKRLLYVALALAACALPSAAQVVAPTPATPDVKKPATPAEQPVTTPAPTQIFQYKNGTRSKGILARTNWTYDAATDSFIQRGTSMVFPGRIGEFVRVRVTYFDDDGNNTSFSYVHPQSRALVTLHTYQAKGGTSLEDNVEVHFKDHQKDVGDRHDGKFVATGEATLVREGTTYPGKAGHYETSVARQKAEGDLFIFKMKDRYLKVRAVHPASDANAKQQVQDFLAKWGIQRAS